MGCTALAACGPSGGRAEGPPAVVVGPPNVVIARVGRIVTGPFVAGALAPAEAATIRAEVEGQIRATYVEEGESVEPGALLVRIEAAALETERRAAAEAVSATAAAVETARRNVGRAEALYAAGGIALRELEDARIQLANAESQLADARARLATAERQLGNTVIRAPIRGEVRAREVSAGDVVQPGAPLVTIIDPTSMRLEAAVPAEALQRLWVGAPVDFRVQGYPDRSFRGRIARINPAADSLTRQARILVTIPNPTGELVADLYADGRVESEVRRGIVLPALAVDRSGLEPTVLRVRAGRAERVTVATGVYDDRTETVEIVAGLAAGDTLLVAVGATIPPGTPVRVRLPGGAGW
ncbi:MAG TPA: efflux RND transporter periplasmic adaptor subunit [Longimicrobiales bacterium]